MKLSWTFKSYLFFFVDLLRAEPILFVAQKHFSRRSKAKVATFRRGGAATVNWRRHADALERYDCRGRVLEFGAGNHLGQNLFLSGIVDQQLLFDLRIMLDCSLANSVAKALVEDGVLDAYHVIGKPSDLQKYGIEYNAPADVSQTQLETASIDACVSTNTLEHIPASDILEIFREIWRVLKLNGICSLKIDYSDHYSHTDKALSPLNFLKFSESEWKKFNHDCHYQNRLRHSEYLEIFHHLGFEIVRAEVLATCEDDLGELPKYYGIRDFRATSGYFLLKKV